MILLERIVRPYQRPIGLTIGSIISRQVAPSADVAVLSWGNTGTLPQPIEEDVPNDNVDFTVELCDSDYTETDRTVQPIKVTQPDKPENYFVVDRIKSMSFKVKEKQKTVGAIRSTTTTYADTDFGDSAFGAVDKTANCKSTFNLAGT